MESSIPSNSPDRGSLETLIRPAEAEDRRRILELIRASKINPFGVKWSRFIVAVSKNDQLIGCGQVKRHRDGSQELASVAVGSEWRGQGVARSIIGELMSIYGRPLWLTCIDRLVPFYEPFGFEEIVSSRQMPFYFRSARRTFNLFLKIRRTKNKLAVMAWQ